jgi:hypothetical protein
VNFEVDLVPSDPVMDELRMVKGIRSCWTHGRVDRHPLSAGDLVVIDLTPEFDGYCANLARTFVLGRPDDVQRRLIETYEEMRENHVLMPRFATPNEAAGERR